MQQRSSLLKWLDVTESIRVFMTRQIDNSEELHAQLVWVESELDDFRKAAADVEE